MRCACLPGSMDLFDPDNCKVVIKLTAAYTNRGRFVAEDCVHAASLVWRKSMRAFWHSAVLLGALVTALAADRGLAEEPKARAPLQADKRRVYCVAFSPDGKTLASSGADATIKLWDVATGKITATLDEKTGHIQSVAFSPDGKTLASGSLNGTIKLWDVAT